MSDDARVKEASAKVGLHHGRMIGGSKSGYRRAYPANAVVFNAAVADADGRDLWRGDLDLTVDEPKLIGLAAELGVTIHVLYEGDARPIGKRAPYRIDVAPSVVRITPEGETTVGTHWRVPRLRRNEAGQLEIVRES